jgi:hypothetical protein
MSKYVIKPACHGLDSRRKVGGLGREKMERVRPSNVLLADRKGGRSAVKCPAAEESIRCRVKLWGSEVGSRSLHPSRPKIIRPRRSRRQKSDCKDTRMSLSVFVPLSAVCSGTRIAGGRRGSKCDEGRSSIPRLDKGTAGRIEDRARQDDRTTGRPNASAPDDRERVTNGQRGVVPCRRRGLERGRSSGGS